MRTYLTQPKLSSWFFCSVLTLLAAHLDCLAQTQVSAPSASEPSSTAPSRISVFVELEDPAPATIYSATMQLNSGKISPRAAAAKAARATQAQVSVLKSAQARVAKSISVTNSTEIFRLTKSLNGIALLTDIKNIPSLKDIPGVRRILPLTPKVMDNARGVPYLKAPQVWEGAANVYGLAKGEGIKIGVIDTGIDYMHADFGGTGLSEDYSANDRTIITEAGAAAFPTAKIVGGYDFVGDSYNASATDDSATPHPDPDPMDCSAHGTHVAGTIAGLGVNADGTSYRGPYTSSIDYSTLRIGPGVAPAASLYALRVFGCSGSTSLVVVAIDWAMDPNDDGDFSDHLDVLNLSLGSSYKDADDPDVLAAENAALVGVIVVNSAGNSQDAYYIMGGVATGRSGISVAAISDGRSPNAALVVSSPPSVADSYVAAASAFTNPSGPPPPMPTGQSAAIVLADDGTGASSTDACEPIQNTAAISGNIALIDRGICNFTAKVLKAQDAGAIGVIVVNNANSPYDINPMGGTGSSNITIPSVSVSYLTGIKIKDALVSGQVQGSLISSSSLFADSLAMFSSRGTRTGPTPLLKPDISAPGVDIVSALSGIGGAAPGSVFAPGNLALTDSGTSMSTPFIAGVMALLKQIHPLWQVHELKAALMNYATHNIVGSYLAGSTTLPPQRTGAGRADALGAATGDVIAFDKGDPKAVSLSFGPGDTLGESSLSRNIRLVNQSGTDHAFDITVDPVLDTAGASLSLPNGSTVNVPANGSIDVPITLKLNGAQMVHSNDPSQSPFSYGAGSFSGAGMVFRHWVTEAAGFIGFRQNGATTLRLPFYYAPRPVSQMSASPITTGGAVSGTGNLIYSGSDVCTGVRGDGPTCSGNFPSTEVSLVTPFELQVASPRNPNVSAYADLQFAGVSADAEHVMFGVSTWGEWSSPNQVAFNVYIDSDNDGTWDKILLNSNVAQLALTTGLTGTYPQDTFVNAVYTISGGTWQLETGSDNMYLHRRNPTGTLSGADSRLFNTNVMFLSATRTSLGIADGQVFRYKVASCAGSDPICAVSGNSFTDEASGPYTWRTDAPGLAFGGAYLSQDLSGSSLPFSWNATNMLSNDSYGGLLLHHFNATNSRAQIVPIDTLSYADLAIAQSVDKTNPSQGSTVTFTTTVTNPTNQVVSGIVVQDELPSGLSYKSASGSGNSYSRSTGIWDIGELQPNSTATLTLSARVVGNYPMTNVAQIVASSLLDTNLANNMAETSLLVAEQADLAVVVMGVTASSVHQGDRFSYTLRVSNNGPSTAYNLDIPSPLLKDGVALTPISATKSLGTYDSTSGLWEIASLNSGAIATLDLSFETPSYGGALLATSQVLSSTPDPDSSNNTASSTIHAYSEASMSGTMSLRAKDAKRGTLVHYSVTLENSGPYTQQDNSSPEFTDTLPSGLKLVSARSNKGTLELSLPHNTVTWNGSLAPNETVVINIDATIVSQKPSDRLLNRGRLSFDEDGDGVNEASATTNSVSFNTFPLVVLSPNGGERLRSGNRMNIRWKGAPSVGDRVSISLLKGNRIVSTLSRFFERSGSYSWTIPKSLKASRNYRIQASSLLRGGPKDSSDGAFEIAARRR